MRSAVPVGLTGASLITDAAGTLVFTTTGRANATLFCDCARWKPHKTLVEGLYVIGAARSPSGRWLVYGSRDTQLPRSWILRTYDDPNAPPSSEEPEPFAIDTAPILAALAGVDLRIESAQTHAIDAVAFFGEDPLVVPRHAGVGARRWPWMKRDGAWTELRELPEFTKAPTERDRPFARTVRLGDGTDVLVWCGAGYEVRGGRFARTFEHALDLRWYVDAIVASGEDGFFCVGGDALLEVHRGAAPATRHLPGTSVYKLAPGPRATLLVEDGSGWMLYDPRRAALAPLPEELSRAHFVRAAGDALVIGTDVGQRIERFGAREIDALEWTSAAVRPSSYVAPSYEGRLPASRPRLAVLGDTLALAKDNELRLHTVDAPIARAILDEEIVSVAASDGRIFALEISGKLHAIDPKSARVVSTRATAHAPRALVGSPRAVAVLAQDSVEVDGRRLPFDAPIAGAFGEDGALLVVSNAGDAMLDGAPAPRAPERVHALARGPGGWLALGERSLLSFTRAGGWSVVRGAESGTHIACSDDGQRIAWCSAKAIASLVDGALDERSSIAVPDRLSEPDEAVSVIGLGFLDEDRWVVAYSGARANILAPKGVALKLDPFPGDAPSRWVFVFDGNILIAE